MVVCLQSLESEHQRPGWSGQEREDILRDNLIFYQIQGYNILQNTMGVGGGGDFCSEKKIRGKG